MAGLIYTANFGGYDKQQSFGEPEDGIDYRVFADLETKDPRFTARNVKVMAPLLYPGWDWYLWLDATMEITAPVMPLVEKLLASQHDFAAFKHNEWACSYVEIGKCIDRKKDTKEKLELAASLLLSEKLPKNFGQAATGVLWRRNTELVKEHALAWWIDMQATTMRDQCTFMLNLWSKKIYLEWMPGLHTKNEWFKYHRGHLK